MFQEDERTQPGAEESGCEKSILMGEDDDTFCAFLVLALRQETPYVVHWVSDGFEALRAIREDKPDLLILDDQLPRMNGIDLYDKIHPLPGFEHIPVIMVHNYQNGRSKNAHWLASANHLNSVNSSILWSGFWPSF
ncbi:MAG TPA: response regulator [Ktedonobacteraceae bacterium]|nr:response regulator [Ktedonobacteraceae bacterium]